MEEFEIIVIGTLLLIQSICDIRWKKIPLFVTAIGIVAGSILFFLNEKTWIELGLSCCLGLMCLLFSKMSREALGYGDSFLLCMMGFFYSIEELLFILMLAMGLAGVVAVFLLMVWKKNRKYEIAFVPFLFVAYGIHVWIRI